MTWTHPLLREHICRIGLFSGLVLAIASPALAQSQGRVVQDGAVIWRSDVSVVAATVTVGTVLEIRAQSQRWYEVVIPSQLGGHGERGVVAKAQLQLLPGSSEPPVRMLRGNPGAPPAPQALVPPRQPSTATPQQPRISSSAPQQQQASRPAVPEPAIGVRGFGQVGYTMFTARKSFEAILGQAHGASFGGGAQVRFANGAFAQVSWERFQQTGQQVFVFEETVFPLGTRNTLTIVPVTITGGYRFIRGSTAIPYVGGGLARYRLREVTPFSDEDEELERVYTGYQAIGGVEFRLARWMATAIEGQYASVPDALGVGGVSEVFKEHNLGGSQVQIKLLVGR